MNKTRGLAKILFFIIRTASLLFLSISLYSLLILGLSFYSGFENLPISVENSTFIIFYPFTKIPFLAGDFTRYYMLISVAVIFLYACFLWLLSNVFKSFRERRLFTQKNVNQLRTFYLFNFIAPVVVIIYLLLAHENIRDVFVILFLHLMIGVFSFFMAEIFNQGLLLQEEQDLTL